MTEVNLFYYPYEFFTNAQLPLLKLAVLWFNQPICSIRRMQSVSIGVTLHTYINQPKHVDDYRRS
jgi:hypothetical protein